MPLFVAEVLFASVSGDQQNESAGLCGLLSISAQLSSTDGVRASRDDFVCSAGPGHCQQSQTGRFCQMSGPLQPATNREKLSEALTCGNSPVFSTAAWGEGQFQPVSARISFLKGLKDQYFGRFLSERGEYTRPRTG